MGTAQRNADEDELCHDPVLPETSKSRMRLQFKRNKHVHRIGISVVLPM